MNDGLEIVSPPLLNLSAENLSRAGIYLMDHGKVLWDHEIGSANAHILHNISTIVYYGYA